MASLTVAVPDSKWAVIARIAACERMAIGAWMDDFIAQQIRIALETARRVLDMQDGEFQAQVDGQEPGENANDQAILDAFVEDLWATYDFDGLLAMHERPF
ncbi:MAG: hypothetical protein GYA24_02790 [Candidatus Lokiarchaeota archaeon]|nr:hypothetical protein [Candidatus Lokiarchaeota archaeon]